MITWINIVLNVNDTLLNAFVNPKNKRLMIEVPTKDMSKIIVYDHVTWVGLNEENGFIGLIDCKEDVRVVKDYKKYGKIFMDYQEFLLIEKR